MRPGRNDTGSPVPWTTSGKIRHRRRDAKQLVDRTVMPLLVEDIRPGEQQMRTQREVEGVVGEG